MKHAITASYYCLLLACLCLSNPSPAYSDPESQLTSIRYSTVPSYVTSLTGSNFAYDNYGRETSESNDWESTGTSYDDNDDILGVTKGYVSASTGATMTQGTWSHQYWPDGSLKDQELYIGTGAYPIYYYYDNLGRMTAVTDATSSAGQETDYSYYSNGWLQSRTEWPEGRNSGPQAADTATYTYNPRGFMIDLKTVYPPSATQNEFGATSGTSEMQYDAAGNLLSMPVNDVSYSSLSGTTSYTYNSQNEVTQETSTRNGGYTYNYNYDAAGNATEMRNATQYFNADNQLTGSYGYTYDGDGNPTAYANTTAAYALSYDTEDRLTAAYISGAPQMYARYDADGLRAWQEESSIFTYDIYDGDDLFALATASGSNVMSTNYYQVFGPNGLISQTGSGWAQFYANDPLGNASQVDGYYYGNLGYPYISDAYGLVPGTGTSTGGYTIGAGFTVPLGTLYDNGLGYGSSGSPNLPLTLMGHREYDANTGRFLTRDPIGYAGGINQYAYADDNPVGSVDPEGLATIWVEYRRIRGVRLPVYHTYLVIQDTNAQKTEYVIRGGPGGPGGSKDYGSILVNSWLKCDPDDIENNVDLGLMPGPRTLFHEKVYEDDKPASFYLKIAGKEKDRINSARYPYEPYGLNSNSVTSDMLSKFSASWGGHWTYWPNHAAPGWDYPLY